MAVDQAQAGRGNDAAPGRTGVSPPVFVVHGMHGFVRPEPTFVAVLKPGQPLHLFELPGLRNSAPRLKNVEDVAASYVCDLQALCGAGPVQLVAFCMGSLIGVEMAHQLDRAGRRPARLVLIEPHMPGPLTRLHEAGAWEDAKALAEIQAPRRRRRTEALLRKALFELGRAGRDPLVRRYPDERFSVDARAKLLTAFRSYRPRRLDWDVDVIASRERADLVGPGTAWDRCLPRRRLHVAGDTHDDVLASRDGRTAALLARLLD